MSGPIRLSHDLRARLTALLHGQFGDFTSQATLQGLVNHIRTTSAVPTMLNEVEYEASQIIDAARQENPQVANRLNALLTAVRNYRSLALGVFTSEQLQQQRSQLQADDPNLVTIEEQIRVQGLVNQDNAAQAQASTQALLEIESSLPPLTPPSSPSAQRRVIPQPPPSGLPPEFWHIDTTAPVPDLGPNDQMDAQRVQQIRGWLSHNLTDDGFFCMSIEESREQLETLLDFFDVTVRTGAAQVQATGLRSFDHLVEHANDISSALNVANAALNTAFEGSAALAQELLALIDAPLGNFTNQAGTQDSLRFSDLFPVNRTAPLTDTDFYLYYYRVVTEPDFAAQNGNEANARAIIANLFITLRQVSNGLGRILSAYQRYIDGLDASAAQASWYTSPRSDDDPDAPAPPAVVTEPSVFDELPPDFAPETPPSKRHAMMAAAASEDVQTQAGEEEGVYPEPSAPEPEAPWQAELDNLIDQIIPDQQPHPQVSSSTSDSSSDTETEDEIENKAEQQPVRRQSPTPTPEPPPSEQPVQAPPYFLPPTPSKERPYDTRSEGRGGNVFSRFFNSFRSGLGSRSKSESDLTRRGMEQPQFEEQEEFDWTQQTKPSRPGPSQPEAGGRRGVRGSTHFPFIKWKATKKTASPTGPSDPDEPAGPSGVTEPSDQASRNRGPYRPWTGLPIENRANEYDLNACTDGVESLNQHRTKARDTSAEPSQQAAARRAYTKAIAQAIFNETSKTETPGKFGFDEQKLDLASSDHKAPYRFNAIRSAYKTLVIKNPKLQPESVKASLIENSKKHSKELEKDNYYPLRMNNLVVDGAVVGRTMSSPRVEALGNLYQYLYDTQTPGLHIIVPDEEFSVASGVPMVRYYDPVPIPSGRARVILEDEDEHDYPVGSLFMPPRGIETPDRRRISVTSQLVREHFAQPREENAEQAQAAAAPISRPRASHTREMCLTLERDGHIHMVNVLVTIGWPINYSELGSADIDELLELRKRTFGSENLSQVVTHSIAGTGRAAVLLAAEAAVNLGLPIVNVVSWLRGSRNQMMLESQPLTHVLVDWAQTRGLPILPDEPRGPVADQHGNFAPAPASSLSPDQLPPGQQRPSFVAQQPQAQPQPQEESDTEDEA